LATTGRLAAFFEDASALLANATTAVEGRACCCATTLAVDGKLTGPAAADCGAALLPAVAGAFAIALGFAFSFGIADALPIKNPLRLICIIENITAIKPMIILLVLIESAITPPPIVKDAVSLLAQYFPSDQIQEILQSLSIND
jgi:hypothetical protein